MTEQFLNHKIEEIKSKIQFVLDDMEIYPERYNPESDNYKEANQAIGEYQDDITSLEYQLQNMVTCKTYGYSEGEDMVIIQTFKYKGHKYTWHEDDCVYYHDEIDGKYLYEVPSN